MSAEKETSGAVEAEKRRVLISLLVDLLRKLGHTAKLTDYAPTDPDGLCHDILTLSAVVSAVLAFQPHHRERAALRTLVQSMIKQLRPFTKNGARKRYGSGCAW